MFLLIVLVLGLATIIFWRAVEKHKLEAIGTPIAAASMILTCVFMITYSHSLGTIANMEAFYKRNHAVYVQAVEEFPNSGKVITKNDATNVITLPYDKVIVIAEYNKDLTWYKKYQDHWFVAGFVSKAPDDLDYIVPRLAD